MSATNRTMTLNQIKQEIAVLLNVESVTAKTIYELAKPGTQLLAAIQSIDALYFNLRTTETWQALLNYLKGEGVNENLSSDVVEVTGNEVNQDETTVNYKGFNYNPKNQHVTMDNTLIGKCLPENFITAINNGWFNILSCCIGENDLICQLPSQEITETTCTIVATETSDTVGVKQQQVPSVKDKPFNYTAELLKLKSLSQQEFMQLIQEVQHVKHFSSYYLPKWEVVETYFTKDEYELATKVELAENDDECHWLKLLDIQDCFSEAGNYHYQQMQLKPKLYLFSAMTEFVYLANCFTYLLDEVTRYNQQWNKLISNFSSSVFETWYSINGLVHKSYIPQPLPSHEDYVTMLQLLQSA